MTSSNRRGIFTVIYDPETGLLFAPDNDVLVCDVPINEIETDTEQIEYIQANGIPLIVWPTRITSGLMSLQPSNQNPTGSSPSFLKRRTNGSK